MYNKKGPSKALAERMELLENKIGQRPPPSNDIVQRSMLSASVDVPLPPPASSLIIPPPPSHAAADPPAVLTPPAPTTPLETLFASSPPMISPSPSPTETEPAVSPTLSKPASEQVVIKKLTESMTQTSIKLPHTVTVTETPDSPEFPFPPVMEATPQPIYAVVIKKKDEPQLEHSPKEDDGKYECFATFKLLPSASNLFNVQLH